VRALGELRAERAAQINRQSTAAMAFESGQKSGAKVIEAKNLDLAFGELEILKGFFSDSSAQRPCRACWPEWGWKNHIDQNSFGGAGA
jgi:ATPase subunit of ABC transporter with duplicated ATPase domains